MAHDQSPETPPGTRVWKGTLEKGEELSSHHVVALTTRELHFATFENKVKQQRAYTAIKEGGEPEESLGQAGTALALADIVRVEKAPDENCLHVLASGEDREEWSRIECPDETADKVFQALRKRLTPAFRQRKAGGSLFRPLTGPASALVLIWIFAGLMVLGVNSRPPEPGQWESNRSAGLRAIANFLGVRNSLLIAGLLTVAACTWAGIAIMMRPNKRVLERVEEEPKAQRRKAARARAAEESDEDEAPRPRRQSAAAKQPAPKPRVKKKPRAEGDD